jgi:hypothetical protein
MTEPYSSDPKAKHPKFDEPWKWHSAEKLAAIEDVSVRTIYRWVNSGKAKKRETGNRVEYRVSRDNPPSESSPSRQKSPNIKDYPLDSHRSALNDAVDGEEKWETLSGHLHDPGYRSWEVCPDEIVKTASRRYAITDKGRLFYLKKDGGISERKVPQCGQYNLSVDGTRWQPHRGKLVERVFSKRDADKLSW